MKLVPPYIAEYQLSDKIQEQARFAIVNHTTEEQIRNNVYKVIQDLEIPAKKQDIKIVANDQVVKISVDYYRSRRFAGLSRGSAFHALE